MIYDRGLLVLPVTASGNRRTCIRIFIYNIQYARAFNLDCRRALFVCKQNLVTECLDNEEEFRINPRYFNYHWPVQPFLNHPKLYICIYSVIYLPPTSARVHNASRGFSSFPPRENFRNEKTRLRRRSRKKRVPSANVLRVSKTDDVLSRVLHAIRRIFANARVTRGGLARVASRQSPVGPFSVLRFCGPSWV